MIAKVYSAIPDGYDGHLVEVEGDSSKSLPAFNIVGMADKTISEARERVRSAILNSNLSFPDKKVTVNLAPAELTKTGSHLDLPIALAVLVLSKQLLPSSLDRRLFVGELSLDGKIRPVRGIINIIETARAHHFTEVILPAANLPEASIIPDIQLTGADNLLDLLLHLKGVKPISASSAPPPRPTPPTNLTTLDDIKDQALAKRALIIALAGHHNILLSGPPGAGKTLLARTASTLLPPPTLDERIEITKLHSLSQPLTHIIDQRPFRAPHHTASTPAIVGGGSNTLPGEISLAHHGILFLDEFPEFPRSIIEALRQPLEDRVITVARAQHHVTYPANFILIATMNPCPCGYLGDPNHECTCTSTQIHNYRAKISGPILDRIDLIINVEPASTKHLLPRSSTNSEHQRAATAIKNCLTLQSRRFHSSTLHNGQMSPRDIATHAHLTPASTQLLDQASSTFKLSARSYFKIIKVARTIADLAEEKSILPEHISEALAFRQKLT